MSGLLFDVAPDTHIWDLWFHVWPKHPLVSLSCQNQRMHATCCTGLQKNGQVFFFLSLRSLRGPPKLSASHSNYYNLWDDLVGLTSTARNCSDVHVCVHQSTCIHMHWRESPDPTVSVTVMGTLSCTSNNKLPVESLMRVLQLWAWTPPSVKLRLLVLARKISARKDKHITYQESVWWAPKDVKKLDVRAALPWFNSWSFKRPVRIKACRQHV